MKQHILSHLSPACPWGQLLQCYDCIESTNDLAKEQAKNGAPHGTVIVAAQQTAGRGRMGRSFHAPAGLGLYFSLILRPQCAPSQLLHLTCAVAVAACEAVERCTGYRPQIKWTNDLVAGSRKLGGILTELSVSENRVDWAVIGIGINCRHKAEDFPPELQSMATSLDQLGADCSPAVLAARLMETLNETDHILLTHRRQLMDTYRRDCMTLGREILVVRGEERFYATALDIANDGGLVIRDAQGQLQTVQSGEVSVRGLYGYS